MRRITIVSIATLLALVPAAAVFAAVAYDIDTTHSYIGFKVRHMGVASVRGEFREYSGKLMVDEADLANSSIEFEIVAASIDTDNQRRDDHLRSADFLEAETYPTITFRSKSIEKTADGEYRATGDLTIHGVTKEVVLVLEVAGPINDPFGNLRIGIEGGVTIDRQDYGVKFSNVMDNGGLVVGNDVNISFALEAARKAS